ncbi:hypothetical protein EGW08_019156 [Elysia chlorotica]|uniref:G-protein coupled receptors family 1 profile domain-containing protein n=1 Tax=Elysia chlorotica TaxID=188477 RepID=A0A3S1BRD6_ELYCH|nr:hypothetical protein EGW08_019156 [Elysia chlorotica]
MENTNSSESTDIPVDQYPPSSQDKLFEDINEWLKVYYSMFLLISGTVLNILSILTLSQKSFKRSTTSVYLRFLAIVDLFVLYNGLSRHFISGVYHYNIRNVSEVFCKFNQWTTSFGPDISAWILVAVTSERVLSIVRPHSVRLMCTKLTARLTILGIVVALMTTNLPLMLFYGHSQAHNKTTNTTLVVKCTLVHFVHFMDQIWYWLDLLKFVLLPSALLTTFNIIIVSAITRRRHGLGKGFSFRGRKSLASSLNRQLGISSSDNRQARVKKNDAHPKSVYHVSREHLNLVISSGTGSTPSRSTGGPSREETTETPQGGSTRSRVYDTNHSVGNTSGRASGRSTAGNSNSNGRIANSSNSLTVTLVAVNATFVICNAPVMVFLLNRDGWFGPGEDAAYSLTLTVVVMAMYTNNALNFLLYCATGSRFRTEMRALFASCRPSSKNLPGAPGQKSRSGEHSHCSDSSDTSMVSTSVSTGRGTSSSIMTASRPTR